MRRLFLKQRCAFVTHLHVCGSWFSRCLQFSHLSVCVRVCVQESLSLSHAVSLALCNIFQARLAHISAPQNQANGTQNAADAYRVCSVDSLAAGYDLTVGRER